MENSVMIHASVLTHLATRPKGAGVFWRLVPTMGGAPVKLLTREREAATEFIVIEALGHDN